MYDSGPGIILAGILFVNLDGYPANWLPETMISHASVILLITAFIWMLFLTKRRCRDEV